MFALIIIVSLICNSFKLIESSHNYQVQNGVNINPNVVASSIMSCIRKENHMFCLAACNTNQACLTTVYIESEVNDNCILYNKQFDSTETTTSSNSQLFIKKSKGLITI
jgi:hypothetical protein